MARESWRLKREEGKRRTDRIKKRERERRGSVNERKRERTREKWTASGALRSIA